MTVRTLAEAAEELRATKWFIYELCRGGKVEHFRVGRNAIRFTDEQFTALREHLTRSPQETPSASILTPRSRARRTA